MSVVLPAAGDCPFLDRALESIASQTYTNWELVFVLDRPSPELASSAKNFQKKYPEKVQVLHSKEPGISSALNCGILASTGAYFARLDADDIMDPQRLATQVKYLDCHDSVVCVGSQVLFIDKLGNATGASNLPMDPKLIHRLLDFSNVLIHPSVMMRKKTVLEAGLYDSDFNGAEDYHLWLRLRWLGEIANLYDRLTFYRHHTGQFSASKKLDLADLEITARRSASELQEGTMPRLSMRTTVDVKTDRKDGPLTLGGPFGRKMSSISLREVAANNFSRASHATSLIVKLVFHLLVFFQAPVSYFRILIRLLIPNLIRKTVDRFSYSKCYKRNGRSPRLFL